MPKSLPAERREARSLSNRRQYLRRQESGQNNKYMREYYALRKKELFDLKCDRACIRCGFDDARALDFHHRDPKEKEFTIGRVGWNVSRERLSAEIEKCDVLCANCHRIEHNA